MQYVLCLQKLKMSAWCSRVLQRFWVNSLVDVWLGRQVSSSVGHTSATAAIAEAAASSHKKNGSAAKTTRRIYVKKIGHTSCTESLMLGLLNHFRRIYPNVGFFKPVATDIGTDGLPRNVKLMHEVFGFRDDPQTMYAINDSTAYQV
jgi:hypothetical protein